MENGERLLRTPEVRSLAGLSRTSIYRKMAAGEFPMPVRLGRHGIAWRESEVREWVALTQQLAAMVLRMPEVMNMVGLSHVSIYRKMAAGEFPMPVRLGKQGVGWRKSEVQEWIASRPLAASAARVAAASTQGTNFSNEALLASVSAARVSPGIVWRHGGEAA